VNPAHLWLGTTLDNVRDKIKKGRDTHGEAVWTAKLTATDVIAIRQRYAIGDIMQKQLAQEYGVSKHAIWDIVNRQHWRHLP
jgi:DNA-binding XRE family transcriptional regulator